MAWVCMYLISTPDFKELFEILVESPGWRPRDWVRQPGVGRNTRASDIHSSRCAGTQALPFLVLVCLLPD